MTYEMEVVPLTKKQEQFLKVAEMRMLQFSFEVTRRNRIGNELKGYGTFWRRIFAVLRESLVPNSNPNSDPDPSPNSNPSPNPNPTQDLTLTLIFGAKTAAPNSPIQKSCWWYRILI